MKIQIKIGAVALVFLGVANAAMANPRVTIEENFYKISGITASELKAQMKSKGPRGFWARADWYVRWSSRCRVSVKLSYIYPEWVNRSEAPDSLQKSWDEMMVKLREHEEVHGQHGVQAAQEVEKSKCKGEPKNITDKWAQRDKDFDRETRHGTLEGVALP